MKTSETSVLSKLTVLLFLLLISLLPFLTGCERKEEEPEITSVDFTVVPDSDLPQALAALIEEKKSGDMMMTYATESELYVIRGYGTRPSDGYNIQVTQFGKTEDRLIFTTELTGPEKDGQSTSLPTYPYIVIKTEYIELPVTFN